MKSKGYKKQQKTLLMIKKNGMKFLLLISIQMNHIL